MGDTVIISLIVVVAIVAAIILWRASAKPKIYDPNTVDLTSDFDPRHEHFSPQHAERRQKIRRTPSRPAKKPAVAAAAPTTATTTQSEESWNSHLIPPHSEAVEDESSLDFSERRSRSERRNEGDRRTAERRSGGERRQPLDDLEKEESHTLQG